MKRILTLVGAACLLAVSAIGCHHTAGACDCITPPHYIGPHPFREATEPLHQPTADVRRMPSAEH